MAHPGGISKPHPRVPGRLAARMPMTRPRTAPVARPKTRGTHPTI